MKDDAITIKDIARALNKSVSTISKALRKSHDISPETQQLVYEYALLHHYKPNPIAQGFRKGRTKSLGVILTNIDNNFFSQIINGIESVAYKKDYNVIITQTHESLEREIQCVQNLSARSIDGLIISLSAETDCVQHFEEVQRKGLPVVFFDRVADEIDTHRIRANNFKGAYEGTMHLIEQGFKRIAHITSPNSLSITRERLEGYRKALTDGGLDINEEYIKYCPHGGMIPEEIAEVIHQLLALPQKPDAIFSASDRVTLKTFSLLRQLGLRIPHDIAVVGFSNSISADVFDPPLTTVVQPAFDMGQQITELLIQTLHSKRPVTTFEDRMLDTRLEIRKSSLRPV